MDVSVALKGSVAILRISGKVDLYEGYQLRNRTEDLLNDGHPYLVFTCSDVEYVDSTGLGIILRASHTARQKGGRVAVVSPSEAFDRVLSSMRVERYVPVFETEEEALATMTEIR